MKTRVMLSLLLLAVTLAAQTHKPAPGYKRPKPKAAGHGIVLTWAPSTSSGITSQKVCRSTTPMNGVVCTTPLTTFNDNTTATYLDTTGVAGTTYYYTAIACAGATCSGTSNEVSGVFPPNPPTNLQATVQ